MEATIYNQSGKETGKITLPESIFGVPWNGDMVHQVVTSMNTSVRKPVAHTKTRGEVSGGGKKPWQQKGTGRARHGSTRSPIWVGGGVAHGPRNDKNFDRKVNKKTKAKALFAILSRKVHDGEVLFVDTLEVSDGKTATAKGIVQNLSGIKGYEGLFSKKKNAAYVALSKKDKMVERSFGNFSNYEIEEVRNMNPVDVLQYKYVIITKPEEALSFLGGKMKADKKK
ncbi:MAG: 50S ribosomal protein L4 [Candidatus Taylorbacteria bacterium RIFCSPHIGHO2_01_FULL_45_63]|uniref:Large ribosomal subunit protein uL4 n=1 Tax=Candidatus Taylorbacteria bacterium RIFCSPHIGHO2_02_FULL_45_35 TaxID=1802311 RepID=A0A1G2MUP9_9BACT|nr:MAG: 50S ribosomal protein L4 [Candidatus Taylorbacteria bacterium RIFCSPHIGHO2_01_FULL_45_63]OHA26812.1 MAG: 50S ribosomal protein L4 [Candidatus Taylorbacteria bacterium RIFCSPHIGHO2_02_FULL_45_35]OHA33627.1 MAG: 50S ribosomal protein L4 [Candidatus Taylorbacteria bacterium RIFCSPLOWO2_01_FULL_45_34b]